jgi:uncharacterized protein
MRRPDLPLILFFVLAYALAWAPIALLAAIAAGRGLPDWQTLHDLAENYDFQRAGWAAYALTRVQDFAFTLSGIVFTVATGGWRGLVELGRRLLHWRIRWYWYLAALVPFAWSLSLPTLPAFLGFLLLRGAMGEEPGLRGFALPRLRTHTTPVKAALVIGVVWGAWHLPVLLRRNGFEIALFLLTVVALSLILTLLSEGSGGSLIPPLVFHAAVNSTGTFAPLAVFGTAAAAAVILHYRRSGNPAAV